MVCVLSFGFNMIRVGRAPGARVAGARPASPCANYLSTGRGSEGTFSSADGAWYDPGSET